MQARMPAIVLEGDNQDQIGSTRPHLMARQGTCIGMSEFSAVWRFGILPESEAHHAYGVCSENFTWVLSSRKYGEVITSWQGAYIDLPPEFRSVLDWGD